MGNKNRKDIRIITDVYIPDEGTMTGLFDVDVNVIEDIMRVAKFMRDHTESLAAPDRALTRVNHISCASTIRQLIIDSSLPLLPQEELDRSLCWSYQDRTEGMYKPLDEFTDSDNFKDEFVVYITSHCFWLHGVYSEYYGTSFDTSDIPINKVMELLNGGPGEDMKEYLFGTELNNSGEDYPHEGSDITVANAPLYLNSEDERKVYYAKHLLKGAK